ncbi:LOB domain-containing protein 37 [Cajanus cajan]|uniref:LOB domain-containing protein 39 n=1 Tax=Cajanus cajan TaxID=3821 RepID=A0A151SKB3_CAJCA|nr:LOB domain-containing protein 37 [Cajanus cajan]KYP55199.1 LOB domain-containing protein 39 [Cajanus cajan]
MSCNGCRVLRKGCSDSCVLRTCLQWIQTAEAQGHATVFVAKFFGRAGLMSFISNVPQNQRPALFQSLLFEACGRTVNPVNGAVGLLWTGNWHVCQAAVETVLRGGALRPMPDLMALHAPALDETSEAEVGCTDIWRISDTSPNPNPSSCFTRSRSHGKVSSSGGGKRQRSEAQAAPNLDLRLTPAFLQKVESRRSGSPSMTSEESGTTTACLESGFGGDGGDRKVLNLFI